MDVKDHVAAGLADALLAGPAGAREFAERAAVALGRKDRWIRKLSRRVFEHFGSGLLHAQRRELIRFIQNDPGYGTWLAATAARIRHYFLASPPMQPRAEPLAGCILPELPTPGDVAAWLGITAAELDWYADRRGMIRCLDGPLCHYRYRWVPKRQGGYRLIESPKAKLRDIQRKILREILDRVPAHDAAHGFCRGRSCVSYVTPHIGKLTLLRMDLRNFFASIPAPRISALFTALGYPQATANCLAGLCTNSLPTRVTLHAAHSPSSARSANLPGAGKSVRALSGFSPVRAGRRHGCGLYALCRRPCLLRR